MVTIMVVSSRSVLLVDAVETGVSRDAVEVLAPLFESCAAGGLQARSATVSRWIKVRPAARRRGLRVVAGIMV